ncbi:31512_t:CDS:1, partial [Gigaspora margarita]
GLESLSRIPGYWLPRYNLNSKCLTDAGDTNGGKLQYECFQQEELYFVQRLNRTKVT